MKMLIRNFDARFYVFLPKNKIIGVSMHVLALVRDAMPCANHHAEKSICMFFEFLLSLSSVCLQFV